MILNQVIARRVDRLRVCGGPRTVGVHLPRHLGVKIAAYDACAGMDVDWGSSARVRKRSRAARWRAAGRHPRRPGIARQATQLPGSGTPEVTAGRAIGCGLPDAAALTGVAG